MLTGPKKTGRVAKWAIELGENDIMFLRRNEKEMPANFLVEYPSRTTRRKKNQRRCQIQTEPEQESRRAKQDGINDLQTSYKGSASRSFNQKVDRGKRSFEGRYAGEEKLDGPHP
ncbi:hypothetical protein Tco_1061060 [Tanacetum coccineum]